MRKGEEAGQTALWRQGKGSRETQADLKGLVGARAEGRVVVPEASLCVFYLVGPEWAERE